MRLVQKPILVIIHQFRNPGDRGSNHRQAHSHCLDQHIGDTVPVAILRLDRRERKESSILIDRNQLLLSRVAHQADLSGHTMFLNPLLQRLAEWSISVNNTLEALSSLLNNEQRLQ